MSDSFDLRAEVDALQDLSNYEISNEHDILSMSTGQVNNLLDQAIQSVAEASENIADPEVFDIFRSFLKNSASLPGSCMNKILDSITSGLQMEANRARVDVESEPDTQVVQAHRAPLEMYAFLLRWFAEAAEKVKAAGDDDMAPKARRGKGSKAAGARAAARKETWTWEEYVPATLGLIFKVLRIKTLRIWTTTPERDAFIDCITQPAYHLWESEAYMKSSNIREGIFDIICTAVKSHGHAQRAALKVDQALTYHEHLSEHMAELLHRLSEKYSSQQLGEDVVREIAGKSFHSQEGKTPRSYARFLTAFAELEGEIVLKQLAQLLNQLDSESYPIRIAIVEIMGSLIKHLATANLDDEKTDLQLNQKQIIGLYDLLLERINDLSTYVRSKVYQVFARLLSLDTKFPKQRLAMTRAAITALQDKAPSVRKSAIALLDKLVTSHPYFMHGGTLSLELWTTEYEKVVNKLKQVEETVGKSVEREASDDSDDEEEDGDEDTPKRKRQAKNGDDDEMDVDEDEPDNEDDSEEDEDMLGEERPTRKKKKAKKPHRSSLNMTALGDEQAALAALETSTIDKLRLMKKYHAEALNFIKQLEECMETMADLLGSKSKPEVLEVIEFFKAANQLSVEGAQIGIRKMLHLIWQKDNNTTSDDGAQIKGVRQGLLDCYNALYFEPVAGMEPRQQINRIAKNMIELTYDASLADLTSLEELLRTMMMDKRIHQDIINKLWQVYSADKQLPRQQRRGAILIIGMLALAKREIVTDHVDTLLKVGCGHLGKRDLVLAKHSCLALQRLNGSVKKVKGSLDNASLRVDMDNIIFRKMQEMIVYPCRSKEWFPLAEQIINTVYALGDHPDVWCDNIIKTFTQRAFASRTPATQEPMIDPMEEDQDPDASRVSDAPTSTPKGSQTIRDPGDAFAMSQLLFVVGHVAIKHIAYLELVEREWKRQKDEKNTEEKRKAKDSQGPGHKDVDELDQVAGNAEDEIGDRIHLVRETELLYGDHSLLALFGPMIVKICASPHLFKSSILKASGILAFCKFLCVSQKFCEQHLWLLYLIQERSKDASTRSNIVIALGDVAVSFTTIIDEEPDKLYRGLSDPDLVVKKNTLMVLTHLILNGMIKVKGQLGELAKCLEDEDQRIADLAKMFFSQLSTKDNAIYNNLQDVISHLSMGEHALEEEAFQSTMKYIFTFIEKERQAESIVEKLCQRFRDAPEPRQWRDIAFCLSLLPYKSDRSVKKLIEGMPNYQNKLHEKEVFDRLVEILTKARSNKAANKPDAELNEFEALLEEHKRQGEDDHDFEKRVAGKKAVAKKRATRRAARTKKPARHEEEEDDE